MKQWISTSVEQTEKIAAELARALIGGETILLDGELGAGKTHFTKGLAVGLDIDELVTSPTFALHNMYHGRLTLNHFDFYRVDDCEEVEILGLNEFFGQPDCICVIEWAQNIAALLPVNAITVRIDKVDDDTRKITLFD